MLTFVRQNELHDLVGTLDQPSGKDDSASCETHDTRSDVGSEEDRSCFDLGPLPSVAHLA